MNYAKDYLAQEPTRAEIDGASGVTLLEFGAPDCGFCRAIQPAVAAALDTTDPIAHIKVEDGSGRPLGRTFGVKLWPTFVLLRDGAEVGRVVRPGNKDIRELLVQR
jgi:thioredoxin 1